MRRILMMVAAASLAACAQSGSSPKTESAKQAEVAAQTGPVQVYAPTGVYRLDPNHASLTFSVNHLGLSNYTVRLEKLDGTINFDAANVAASTVTFTVDPASVKTGFRGDYRAQHPRSTFRSWDEELAKSANFLNTGEFAEAAFQSTSVEVTGPGKARVSGELSLLGQTRPASFEVTWNGSTAKHPFTKAGAFGVSAVGVISRTDYGMSYLLGTEGRPDIVGDAVTLKFEGEFLAAPPTR